MQKQRPSISVDQQSSIFQTTNSVINWQSLYQKQRQIRLKLEQENKILKIKYERVTGKKLTKETTCQKCSMKSENTAGSKDIKKIKGQLQSFSKQIECRLNKITERMSEDMIQSSMQQIEEKEQVNKSEIPFIENFAVLGIDDDSIANFKKDELEGGVILSMRKVTPVQQHAVHFAVPSGMNVKEIPSKKILEKVPKIMINHSKQNTFLLCFNEEPGRLDNLSPEAQELLDMLNPKRRLFCFCVGTYDFTYLKKQLGNQNDISLTNNSFEIPRSSTSSAMLNNSDLLPSVSSIIQAEREDEGIRVSQRVYCIMSYFPFFSFFSNILLSLLNLIKLQRLQIFRDRIEDIKKIDSRFQLRRIKKLYNRYLRKFNKQPVRLDMVYHLNLMNQNLLLQIDRRQILYSQSEEWDYQIMSLFTLDKFMEVLTLFLLEDKLFFVCDQSRILTFAVYLVSTYLCRPFKWAYQYVTIVPKEEEFLNTPFPSAYGVLKKRAWLDDKNILKNQHFKNTYVLISPAGIEIVYTEDRKDILSKKSKVLRQQLAPFFQKMEKRRKDKRQTLKYQNERQTEYNWYSQREDRNIIIGILETLKGYLTNQVLHYIPTLQTLRKIKDRVHLEVINEKKDPHSYLIQQIVSYIISQRKTKDPFVDQLLKTQMLSQHISELVDKVQ